MIWSFLRGEVTARELRDLVSGVRIAGDGVTVDYIQWKGQTFLPPAKDDPVTHPSHYTQYQGFEVIDVARQLVGPDKMGGFHLGNAFKYIARAGFKKPEKHVEDLEKAVFYIQAEIERIKKQQKE